MHIIIWLTVALVVAGLLWFIVGTYIAEATNDAFCWGYIQGIREGMEATQDAEYDRGYQDGFESAEGGGE